VVPTPIFPSSLTKSAVVPLSCISKSPDDVRLNVVFPVPALVNVKVSVLSCVMVVFVVKSPPQVTADAVPLLVKPFENVRGIS